MSARRITEELIQSTDLCFLAAFAELTARLRFYSVPPRSEPSKVFPHKAEVRNDQLPRGATPR